MIITDLITFIKAAYHVKKIQAKKDCFPCVCLPGFCNSVAELFLDKVYPLIRKDKGA